MYCVADLLQQENHPELANKGGVSQCSLSEQ